MHQPTNTPLLSSLFPLNNHPSILPTKHTKPQTPKKQQDHGFSTWFWRMTLIYVGAATIFQANLAVSAWTIFLNTGHQMALTQAKVRGFVGGGGRVRLGSKGPSCVRGRAVALTRTHRMHLFTHTGGCQCQRRHPSEVCLEGAGGFATAFGIAGGGQGDGLLRAVLSGEGKGGREGGRVMGWGDEGGQSAVDFVPPPHTPAVRSESTPD